MKFLSKLYFRITGWKIEGNIPEGVNKCVMVAAPHTTNYDYPITMAVFFILGIKIRYLAKKELLDSPLGPMFKATGAIGVDRSKNSNLINTIVDIINKEDEIVMIIPAEGTRKLVKKWKTGFYYVALGANVPIVLAYLDYEKKIGGIGHMFYPTGNFEEDMDQLKEFYKDKVGKYPENFSLEIY